jgi:DNA-binding SARP family transcriptional activator/tetratricopeptide (TPR) repeat protein
VEPDGRRSSGCLGPLLRGYRVAAGLTQGQLASRSGVSVGALRDMEQGRTTRPRAASVTRLAEVLQLGGRQRAELAALTAGPRVDDAGAGAGRASGQDGDVPGVRLAVLGPLVASRAKVPVVLGPARQRAVLGLLAVHEGSGLSRAAVTDALWGEEPPATAGEMIQGYVSRLRRLLWPGTGTGEGAPWRGGAALSWDGACYRLAAGAVHCDLVEFGQLSDRARRSVAAGDAGEACRLYGQALRLWRGQPLADLDIVRGHPVVAGLDRRHADVVIEYADAAGAAGLPGDAVRHLWALAGREPLDERAHARLMAALAACGQRAAALGVYEGLRLRLDEELGVRPGPELAEAHIRVLRHEAGGTVTVPGHSERRTSGAERGRDAPEPVLPRQLPPQAGHFAGRAAELAELTGLLDQAGEQTPGTVVISAIGGTAGVGKTALALYWAHQVAERFPDGQLYVNLRGYDPDQPVPAADALAGFLRALGVAGQDIPAEADERAGRYRSLLAGRRVLVVLDNAGEVEQVRPLLPGMGSCVAVVTSRDSLAGLVARDGARRLDLDLLPPADAVGLLRALIGGRVDADPGAAAALATQCSRLPLALRVAAELAVARPGVSLADLAGELADQQRRLDLLDAGEDPRTAVRAVFSWSYRHLDASAARAFRLAGLHPGPDLDPYAAAALTDSTVERVGRLLDQLARVHLIQPARPGRHGIHDLLRTYARELAAAQGDQDERRAALTRLFDYYLHAAAAAMDTLYPAEHDRRPRIPPSTTPAPPLAVPAAARAWLDAERANLVAVAAHTAGHGWPGHTIRLAAILFRYLDAGGHYPEAVTIHTCSRRAAQGTGDRAAEAAALTSLGAVHTRQGRYQQATDHHQQALALYQQAGDRAGEARALNNLGNVDLQQGRCQRATSHLQQALALYQQTGDRTGEARALNNLALVEQRLGRYQQATSHLQQALALFRETGDRPGEAYALGNLGDSCLRQGRYQQATGHLRQALALFRAAGDRPGQADALTILGDVDLQQGRDQQAADHHQQALALFRETGYRPGEAKALNGLGEAFLAADRPGHARTQHTTALGLASQAGDQHQQARAHTGLAHSYHATGDPGQARHHWHAALTFYTGLGAPEADQVRAQLATVGDNGHHEP